MLSPSSPSFPFHGAPSLSDLFPTHPSPSWPSLLSLPSPQLLAPRLAAPLLPTGATLLICPASILAQWKEEIDRHVRVNTLRVLEYSGLLTSLRGGRGRGKSVGSLHPTSLAKASIVLTSLETLRSELSFAPKEGIASGRTPSPTPPRPKRSLPPTPLPDQGKRKRDSNSTPKPHPDPKCSHGARRQPPMSPLLGLEWWRVVVDEAQGVESTSARAAAMAGRLNSVNRWAVSGTPMGRSR